MNKKIKKLGIPYMGSKRKLAEPIVDFILKENPNCKYIYDLFGGGGAISFEAAQREEIKQVFYNEYDTTITELLKKIQNEGITEEFYKWYSREEFFKLKNGKTWESGLIKTCWSFGNNVEKGYIYGKNIEEDNKKVFNEIINNSTMENRNEVRLKKEKEIKHLKAFCRGIITLQRINQLIKLKKYINFNITNLSYEEVEINTPLEETVIYLDPPYQATGKYQNDINHEEFYNWVRQQPYNVYISGYEAPSDFEVAMEMEHRSTLSATANNKVVEKLFCNKGDNK